MKHLGNITKIRVEGGLTPITDVVIGGSPCQNLSVAGNRKGLEGEQSALFLEQIRIVKEMRKCANDTMKDMSADLWSGRMFLERLAQTKEKTSAESSKKSAESVTNQLLFLDLRMENGNQLEPSWETITALHGEFSTHDGSAYHNAENASHLSQILQDEVPQKYYLSKKACEGILRRSETRGKPLPPILKQALEQQMEDSNE